MSKKTLLIVIAVLAALAVLFAVLWGVSDEKLKQLRSQSASAVADSLTAYMQYASEEDYRDAVGHMRAFLDSWEKAGGKGKAYDACTAVYDAMLRDPRLIYEYAEDLVDVMEKLSGNIKDADACKQLERIGPAMAR